MTHEQMGAKLRILHDSNVVWDYQSDAFRRLFTKFAKLVFAGRKPRRAYEHWCSDLQVERE